MGAGRKLFAFLLVLLLGAAAVYLLFFHEGGQIGDGTSSTSTTSGSIKAAEKKRANRLGVSGGSNPKAAGVADPKATTGSDPQSAAAPKSPVSQPAQSAAAPKSPVSQPAPSAAAPKSPVSQPAPSAAAPKSPVSQPAQSAATSKSPASQPAKPQSKLSPAFLNNHKLLKFGSSEMKEIQKKMKDSAAEDDKEDAGKYCPLCDEEFSEARPAVAMKCCRFSQLACEDCLAENLALRPDCPFCRADVLSLKAAKSD